MKKIYLLAIGLCLSFVLTFISTGAMAQSPGGVSTGLSLWLKADATSTLGLTGNTVNSWTYFNNSSNTYTFTGGTNAQYVASALNGLPSISFGGNSEMDGPTGANAPLAAGSVAYSVFSVWNSSVTGNTFGPFQRIWAQWDGHDATDGVGCSVWLWNGQWGDQPEINVNNYTTGEGRNYTTGTYYISQMNLLNSASNDLELVDQANLGTGPTVLSTDAGSGNTVRANLSTNINSLGYRNASTPGEFFTGNLSELIIYNNSISAGASRNQIFSYLSMKYGIPLSGAVNLVSSTGATIWDHTRGGGSYNNSVFGLGVDNGSGLNVQSSNAATTAGVSGAGNIVLTPFSVLSTDQTFLLTGNDAGALTEETTNIPAYAAGSSRLIRNWFVQNAGTGGAVAGVNLSFDLTGIPITGTIGTTSDFRLIVSAGDPTFATTTGLYTPTSFNGNIANFTGVLLPDGSNFAIISKASGGTPLPVNFITFTAQPRGSNVGLNWTVGDNAEASTYEIDRSADGVAFTKIGEVANAADQTSYSYVDANAGQGTHYYRVLETDQDGKSIYSKIVSATLTGSDFSVAVLNNPAKGSTDAQLQINAGVAGTAFIELWTLDGRRMSLQQEAVGTGTTTIAIPTASLTAGSYVVKVMVGGNVHVAQVVKL